MSHQPFETWIFSDDPIQPEEQTELDQHLQSCEDCRQRALAMSQVQQAFISTPAPIPAPGFTQRWQERLALARQQRQQKRMWLLTLGIFSLANLLALVILVFELGQINWFYEISQVIANLSLVAARINQVWNIIGSISDALPLIAPVMIVFGIGIFSLALALIVTWFSSIIQLYQTAS